MLFDHSKLSMLAGCGKQYPARHPSLMQLHLKRTHKENVLKCDRPLCKFVRHQLYNTWIEMLF